MTGMRLIVAITGANGAALGVRLLQRLREVDDVADNFVDRVLDHFGLHFTDMPRWGGLSTGSPLSLFLLKGIRE